MEKQQINENIYNYLYGLLDEEENKTFEEKLSIPENKAVLEKGKRGLEQLSQWQAPPLKFDAMALIQEGIKQEKNKPTKLGALRNFYSNLAVAAVFFLAMNFTLLWIWQVSKSNEVQMQSDIAKDMPGTGNAVAMNEMKNDNASKTGGLPPPHAISQSHQPGKKRNLKHLLKNETKKEHLADSDLSSSVEGNSSNWDEAEEYDEETHTEAGYADEAHADEDYADDMGDVADDWDAGEEIHLGGNTPISQAPVDSFEGPGPIHEIDSDGGDVSSGLAEDSGGEYLDTISQTKTNLPYYPEAEDPTAPEVAEPVVAPDPRPRKNTGSPVKQSKPFWGKVKDFLSPDKTDATNSKGLVEKKEAEMTRPKDYQAVTDTVAQKPEGLLLVRKVGNYSFWSQAHFRNDVDGKSFTANSDDSLEASLRVGQVAFTTNLWNEQEYFVYFELKGKSDLIEVLGKQVYVYLDSTASKHRAALIQKDETTGKVFSLMAIQKESEKPKVITLYFVEENSLLHRDSRTIELTKAEKTPLECRKLIAIVGLENNDKESNLWQEFVKDSFTLEEQKKIKETLHSWSK